MLTVLVQVIAYISLTTFDNETVVYLIKNIHILLCMWANIFKTTYCSNKWQTEHTFICTRIVMRHSLVGADTILISLFNADTNISIQLMVNYPTSFSDKANFVMKIIVQCSFGHHNCQHKHVNITHKNNLFQ